MVLRKPYAFLIKHFKKIHIILFILMSYGIYKTNNVSNFFSSYVRNSTGFYESTLSKTYINPMFYIACILIILLSTIVLIVMKQKEKPTKLYFILALFYIGLIVLLFSNSDYLRIINYEQLAPRTSRLVKDINFMSLIPQIILIIFVFIRAVGFNIKKFNFAKDIEELQIDVSDNEEFELTIGTDSGNIARVIRKNKREFKYFYLEHKNLIIGIVTILVLIIAWNVYYNVAILNKVYSQNEVVRLRNVSYLVEGFYSTKLDYKSVDISEGKNTFLILKLKIYNGNENPTRLNSENMVIIIGKNIYLPIYRKYEEFKDIGVGYENNLINGDSEAEYIFVYLVSNEDLNKDMILRYNDYVSFDLSGVTSLYMRHNIKPESLDEISSFPVADLKKEVNYSISYLKETKLTIDSVEFNEKFSYKTGDLINVINDPMDNKSIMKISYNYIPDPTIPYIDSFQKLLKEYGTIKYYKDNKEYILKYVDLTPLKYKDSDVYFSVSKEVADSDSIELVINARNLVYIHKLK